jgi:hypothetical protein
MVFRLNLSQQSGIRAKHNFLSMGDKHKTLNIKMQTGNKVMKTSLLILKFKH